MRGFAEGAPVEGVAVGKVEEGDGGLPSAVGASVGVAPGVPGEDDAGADGLPVPVPDASGVQPAARATAAAARTTLRMTAEDRFMIVPRSVSCVRRDASRARAVAHVGP
ncbi:hypothetical protein GCM10010222_06840 [Streptomyces tanashiensis]|nr:hypothetical protein GCM10010222_06840 [Streptomyces tanashiensis]